MNITVVGGGGRVGLPLSIALSYADQNNCVYILDKDKKVVDLINSGKMPFAEKGAEEKLIKITNKNLFATTDPSNIEKSEIIIIIIGTPVDEHLNPVFEVFQTLFKEGLHHFHDDQTVILRSTLYPGTSKQIDNFFKEHNLKIHVSFCPERIAEGKAMEELFSLPQIISGFDEEAITNAKNLFLTLTEDIVVLDPMEAELAKLFTNSWRYIQFAAANQYYMLAQSFGLDFYKIYHAMTYKYPRAKGFPSAGFAAGPCLFKDTMQLSAFSGNKFFLGHSAMLINEGLPQFLVEELKKEFNLREKTIGILGMAFKGESDDKRESLSYKLKKILEFEAKTVLCTDEYIKDVKFLSLEDVIEKSDILIIGTTHNKYRTIKTNKKIIDVWNLLQRK